MGTVAAWSLHPQRASSQPSLQEGTAGARSGLGLPPCCLSWSGCWAFGLLAWVGWLASLWTSRAVHLLPGTVRVLASLARCWGGGVELGLPQSLLEAISAPAQGVTESDEPQTPVLKQTGWR